MLTTISKALVRVATLFRSEKGQALAEYGLILALIAVVAMGALFILGGAVFNILDDIANCLTSLQC